jgi:acylphosphatase
VTTQGTTNQTRLHTIIEGRVQGVGFRYFVLTKAQQLNVSGWVRNTYNGNVEVTAEGDQDQIQDLLDALRKGPRSAFVSKISESWYAPTGEFSSFEVRSTS